MFKAFPPRPYPCVVLSGSTLSTLISSKIEEFPLVSCERKTIYGRIVGMQSFGESAPGGELMTHFGFTVDNVVAALEDVFLD